MLVYCKDEKNPNANACTTMAAMSVRGPIVAKSAIVAPSSTVFDRRTRR